MNTTEGLLRLATVFRWGGNIAGGLLLLAGVIWVGSMDRMGFAEFLIFAIPAFLLSGLGWVVAWVLEGFAKPRD